MKFLLIFLLLTGVQVFAHAQKSNCAPAERLAIREGDHAARKFSAEKRSNASGNFTVNYYRCQWNVDPSLRYISGGVTSYFTVTTESNMLVYDLSDSLVVDSVTMRTSQLSFQRTNNETVTIQLPSVYAAQRRDSVTIYYHGTPAETDEAFVQATHNNVPVLWTLSEPYGAKDWWPCRNGLDDKADSIDIFVTHPAAYRTSSNGLLQDVTVNGFLATTHYKHRYPIASYLVAIAVTNYSVFTNNLQLTSATLPVISYIYPEDSSYFAARTRFMLQAMQFYDSLFGPYPFSKERYGQTQFGFGGGMEHQTNSFINLADEDLMAHELAHQWFGDKVTCKSWKDIWLNEGFASYAADFLYMQRFSPLYYNAYINQNLALIVTKPDGSVLVDDTSSVSRIFSGRLSYAKGAFLVRMLQFTLGDDVFFKAIRNYLSDTSLAYSFASSENLQQHLEEASGQNLQYFFDQWLYGQGYPSFKVTWRQNSNNYANIMVSETTSHPSVNFFKVPLQLVFKNANATDTILLNVTQNNQSFSLPLYFQADTVLIDPSHYLISRGNSTQHITESLAINDISIYPNPVTNALLVSVHNPELQRFSVVLYNVLGQQLYQRSYSFSGEDVTLTIPFTQWPRGVYMLKLFVNDNKAITRKIIK